MSVRHEKRRDPISGKQRKFWMIDVDYEYPDGSRKRIRKVSPIPTKRDAEEYERQIRKELLNPPRKEVPTFAVFVDQRWLPTYPKSANNRHSTIVEKKGHVERYLRPAFAHAKLDEITTEKIEKLLADMAQKDLKPQTRKNAVATLRRILRSAQEWGVIEKLPAIPKIKVPTSVCPNWFKIEQTERLLKAAAGPEELAILLFASDTGVRAGEQLALRWDDVDFSSRNIRIRRSSTLGHVGPTKSGKERTVPLTAGLVSALRAIKRDRGPWVFCRSDGSPLTIWQLHTYLVRACKKAGFTVDERIRWHDLRHSYASQLVSGGIPMRQVQEMLGHGSIVMTQRYSHLAPGSGAAVVHFLDEARGNGNIAATSAKEDEKASGK